MTFLPSDDRRVVAVEGKPYQMNTECAVPGCDDIWSLERHHLWRRSFLNGDHWWVLPPGRKEPVGNCIRLCNHHHRQITGNEARITFTGYSFEWGSVSHPDADSVPLSWQPPGCDSKTPGKNEEEVWKKQNEELARRTPRLPWPEARSEVTEFIVNQPKEFPCCPTCGALPKKKKIESPTEEKRQRKAWTISVPADQREMGADVLDELLDAAREELAKAGLQYGEEGTARYFVLSTALALFVQFGAEVMQ